MRLIDHLHSENGTRKLSFIPAMVFAKYLDCQYSSSLRNETEVISDAALSRFTYLPRSMWVKPLSSVRGSACVFSPSPRKKWRNLNIFYRILGTSFKFEYLGKFESKNWKYFALGVIMETGFFFTKNVSDQKMSCQCSLWHRRSFSSTAIQEILSLRYAHFI
jgi:hypothetical protein